ncbi:MAG TPA: type I restriction enzyme HsdR N-terminal domain-containing protein [Bacteroidetes bacterium]|nr:type I restriction enzyme HsdR N-terminal domain-containing protein [Bacteroidota bacterium]
MKLNIPGYPVKTRQRADDKPEIFDDFRKKFVALTPEEWVRQHFLHFLVNEKGYPPGLIVIEKGLKLNRMQKRFDAVVYSNSGKPVMLLEFKSPDVKPEQKVFDQIAAYNLKMKVDYLLVSNGIQHFCCKINHASKQYHFLDEIPDYPDITTLT